MIQIMEMLFKKKMAQPACDEAPCGTGMHYLAPSYQRVVSAHLSCLLSLCWVDGSAGEKGYVNVHVSEQGKR